MRAPFWLLSSEAQKNLVQNSQQVSDYMKLPYLNWTESQAACSNCSEICLSLIFCITTYLSSMESDEMFTKRAVNLPEINYILEACLLFIHAEVCQAWAQMKIVSEFPFPLGIFLCCGIYILTSQHLNVSFNLVFDLYQPRLREEKYRSLRFVEYTFLQSHNLVIGLTHGYLPIKCNKTWLLPGSLREMDDFEGND